MPDQMLYRKMPSTGQNISLLGFGCMRFPRIGIGVDEAKAERLIMAALDVGINYFDTAFIYPGSEKALGKTISKANARERVLITTKMPTMLVKNRRDMDNIFERQLEHLQTEYVDFYLAHTLTSFADLERLFDKGFGDFMDEELGRGRILGSGFSFHGNVHEFKRIADAYPWGMCMIQYNYIDEYFQAGIEGLRYAAHKGLGVIAMEPLRGGLLGNGFSKEARKLFDEQMALGAVGTLGAVGKTGAAVGKPGAAGARGAQGERGERGERGSHGSHGSHGSPAVSETSSFVTKTPAELALRWVWKHPEVTCAISGMNDAAYVYDNARTVYAIGAARAGATAGESAAKATDGETAPPVTAQFTAAEQRTVDAIKDYYNANLRVNCTSCSYCMPCPYGVDIPTCFYWYNNYSMRKTLMSNIRYILSTEGAINNRPSKASLCNACGMCERKCPQGIKIRANLKAVAKLLEKNWLRIPVKLILNFISNP